MSREILAVDYDHFPEHFPIIRATLGGTRCDRDRLYARSISRHLSSILSVRVGRHDVSVDALQYRHVDAAAIRRERGNFEVDRPTPRPQPEARLTRQRNHVSLYTRAHARADPVARICHPRSVSLSRSPPNIDARRACRSGRVPVFAFMIDVAIVGSRTNRPAIGIGFRKRSLGRCKFTSIMPENAR